MKMIRTLVRRDDGATAIEYGLIAALIAIAIIGGATLLGESLDTLFSDVAAVAVVPEAPETP